MTAAATTAKVLACPLRQGFGFEHVEIAWSLPDVPADVQFGSHVVLSSGAARVAVVSRSSVFISDDGGDSWDAVPVETRGASRLDNAFVCADGGVIVQSRGLKALEDRLEPAEDFARLFVFDAAMNLRGDAQLGASQWHGSGGIDEHDGTVIWGEYAPNPIRWKGEPGPQGPSELSLDSHVYRSIDGGLSWETVLAVPSTDVRHFHVIRADRFEPGVWWASSGDVRDQCRVFRSGDDGRSWAELTGEPTTPFPATPGARSWHALHRYTDVVVTKEHLIWGTDDFLGRHEQVNDPDIPLGRRIGSRLCVARKDDRIRPAVRGWIGNPVRSIVDVGPAWLFVTQAKRLELPRPQLVLVGKEEPFPMQEIGTVDLFGGGTPFTFSRASRVALDGRFFSFRQRRDVIDGGPGVLRWDIQFR